MKKDKAQFEDDGRTIANMNVEGMPWYKAPSINKTGNDAGNGEQPEELTPAGRRAMTGGILAASLLIGSIYAVVILLFILFCIYVWFR